MTSAQIRQSYLDFFKEKDHAIVPSSSLMPDSPNLLFTNAGMNQFVPIFLGNSPCPYPTGRAADTQKCIRAGGKHNDLEDVGFDTYHHTFFEMLGNWSFGNYFKKEAIEWAWELVVGRWKFPANRVYATVYKPGSGDPADFDQEAYNEWEAIFKKAGLDPKIHIVFGNKKDNFWMMGDTGPCGPCSELHIDLTPEGDTQGKLVNVGDAACMEIWNLVFIQFNANADGTFSKLPACHVDTGMGFERVAGIIQGTKNFSDFKNARISNYESDVFKPIFKAIEVRAGKKYSSTLPTDPASKETIASDIAFRVIADHLRTLSFSIADGIIPSNEGRGYVLRRILRRAMNYGRDLGLTEPFLHSLVPVIAEYFGEVFPEVRKNVLRVQDIIKAEEESFQKTIERGLDLFTKELPPLHQKNEKVFPGEVAFELYHTYGFPIDLTQVLARREGLTVDETAVERRKEEERKRSQAAQKKDIIELARDFEDSTKQDPYGELEIETLATATIARSVSGERDFGVTSFVPDATPFYTEMGGQVADSGEILFNGKSYKIKNTEKIATGAVFHDLQEPIPDLEAGDQIQIIIKVDKKIRHGIEAHHSATHIMHWALRKVLGDTVAQKGSYVGPNNLRFDFAYNKAMTLEQINQVEQLVNEKIVQNDSVTSTEKAYKEVKGDPSVLQFFGDKYGEKVRVVDIGGYSKELCGGTHVKKTSDIGWFKFLGEGAIAAGVRRAEALCGVAVEEYLRSEAPKQEERYLGLRQKMETLPVLSSLAGETPEKLWKSFEVRQQSIVKAEADVREYEKKHAKQMEGEFQREAAEKSASLVSQATTLNGMPVLIHHAGEVKSAYLPFLVDALKREIKGAIILAGQEAGRVSLIASVDASFTTKIQAGKIIQALAPIVGGKGGGRPDLAQGGGTQPEKIGEALEKAKSLF